MKKILFKTTVVKDKNDWCVHRFNLLKNTLEEAGYLVESRDRVINDSGDDVDFKNLVDSDYDQLWIFAVEGNDGGLTSNDAQHIDAFRKQGKGCMLTRDHMDVGNTLVLIPEIGTANNFHKTNPEPNRERHKRDDTLNMSLEWPNYHSGLNGSVQEITVLEEHHPLFKNGEEPIKLFPTHPHEGAITIPEEATEFATVLAKGISKLSALEFNLIIAFEAHPVMYNPNQMYGRAVVHSSFHHFADYNWDTSKGAPDFVFEKEGNEMQESSQAQNDIRAYSKNLAHWLSDSNTY